uniref:Palmitoyl-monogalactosyldiacylglycerol delta-7 desaturase, chloroplastic-like n=1 Tax=Cucumis melo TaxID=3656 RepID=A0A9I9DG74_CUCME
MEGSKLEQKDMVKPLRSFRKKKWSKIDRDIAGSLFFVHILCIFAPFHFNWSAFWVAFVLYVITGLFGISISYHRNLAHRSFILPKWLEYLFAYCGVHALQGDPIDWVSTHRCHHRFVDTEKDPHSPIQGFWFSHITWLVNSYVLTKKVWRPENVGDLEKQAFYRFLHKTYFLHLLLLAVLLYAMGGVPFLIWGMGVRIVVVLHITFMVNSVSRHGLEWWEIDFGWYVIKFLQAIGVATHVKEPLQDHKKKLAMDEIKFI